MLSPKLISPSKTINETENHNEKNYSGTLIYVLIGIIICLILIIGALVFSPTTTTLSDKKPVQEVKHNKEEVHVIDSLERKENTPNKNTSNKNINDKIKIDWMLKKIDAEQNKMSIWSKEDFEIALVYEAEAIQFDDRKQYEQSKEKYKDAIKKIEETLLNKEHIFKQLLLNATTYLNEDDLNRAKINFVKAAAIDEENQIIKRGLERINNRNEVIHLYDQAIDEEEKDNIDNSIKYLNKALLIEPEYLKIKAKLNQINKKKKIIDFNNVVSQILKAIDKSQLRLAKEQLEHAKKINPDAPIINELEIQISEKNKKININNLQIKAINYEKNEQWRKAKNSYVNILKIDPNTSFAIVGKERVKYFEQLNQLLDDIVLKPQRLQNEQVFEKSKNSLNYVKNEIIQKSTIIKNKIPKLRKKIDLSENLIKNYSTLITITMHSDNETEVVIYQVAKYGKFNDKNIQLRPGKYTIVGSKEGYRDFRNIINISANDNKKLINVMCKEKI